MCNKIAFNLIDVIQKTLSNIWIYYWKLAFLIFFSGGCHGYNPETR